jgi:hypothetical protein
LINKPIVLQFRSGKLGDTPSLTGAPSMIEDAPVSI